jgi:hypothetical protein
MNANGTSKTRLTTNAFNDFSPVFQLRRDTHLFHHQRDGNDQVYVMNATGSGQTRLTLQSSGNSRPSYTENQADADGDSIGDACDPNVTTATLNPTADTWVQGAEATRNTNYGADTSLQIKRTLTPARVAAARLPEVRSFHAHRDNLKCSSQSFRQLNGCQPTADRDDRAEGDGYGVG